MVTNFRKSKKEIKTMIQSKAYYDYLAIESLKYPLTILDKLNIKYYKMKNGVVQ